MKSPTVRFTMRWSPAMRARLEAAQEQYALPTLADTVLMMVALGLDEVAAKRGEIHTHTIDEKRLRQFYGRRAARESEMDATRRRRDAGKRHRKLRKRFTGRASERAPVEEPPA